MNLVDKITKKQIRVDIPEFRSGDTIKVDIKIDEIDSTGKRKQGFKPLKVLLWLLRVLVLVKRLQLEKCQEMLE